MLHSSDELQLIPLMDLPLKAMRSLLTCTIQDKPTRSSMEAYYSIDEPILNGIILSPQSKIVEMDNEESKQIEKNIHLCSECKTSLFNKKLPPMAIANGFFVNVLPQHLLPLTPADLALTAPVFINASIHVHSKHSRDGQTFLTKHAMLLQNDALILEKSLPRRLDSIPSHVNVIFTSKYTKREKICSMQRHQVNVNKVIDYLHWKIDNCLLFRSNGIVLNNENQALLQEEDQAFDDVTLKSEEILTDETININNTDLVPFSNNSFITEDIRLLVNSMVDFVVLQVSKSNQVDHTIDDPILYNFESDIVLSHLSSDIPQTALDDCFQRISKEYHKTYVYRTGNQFLDGKRDDIYGLAFPHLFPYGTGTPKSPRQRRVSLLRCIQRYLRLSTQQFSVEPFANHFLLVAFSLINSQRGRQAGMMYAPQQRTQLTNFATVSEEDFVEAANFINLEREAQRKGLPTHSLVRPASQDAVQLIRSSYSCLGSMFNTYEEQKKIRVENWAMWGIFGVTSGMVTINPNDTGDLHLNMMLSPERTIDEMDQMYSKTYYSNDKKLPPHNERLKLINCNPAMVSRWFLKLVKHFLNHILGIEQTTGRIAKGGGCYGHVYAASASIQEQERLSLHVHILLWIAEYSNTAQQQHQLESVFGKETINKRFVNFLDSIIQLKCGLSEDEVLCPNDQCRHNITDAIDLSDTIEVIAHRKPSKTNILDLQCNHCHTKFNSQDAIVDTIISIITKQRYIEIMNDKDSFLCYYLYPIEIPENPVDRALHSLYQLLTVAHDSKHRFRCFKHSSANPRCNFSFPRTPSKKTCLNELGYVVYQRSKCEEWLTNHVSSTLSALCCNNDYSICGNFGNNLAITIYVTLYTTIKATHNLVDNLMLKLGFQQRVINEEYADKSQDGEVNLVSRGRGRVMSCAMNLSKSTSTGAPLAATHLTLDGAAHLSTHTFTRVHMKSMLNFLNDGLIYGRMRTINKELIVYTMIDEYLYRPPILKDWPMYIYFMFFTSEINEDEDEIQNIECEVEEEVGIDQTDANDNSKPLLSEYFKYDFLAVMSLVEYFGMAKFLKMRFQTNLQLSKEHPMYGHMRISMKPRPDIVVLVGKRLPSKSTRNEELAILYNNYISLLLYPWSSKEDVQMNSTKQPWINDKNTFVNRIIDCQEEFYVGKSKAAEEQAKKQAEAAVLRTFIVDKSNDDDNALPGNVQILLDDIEEELEQIEVEEQCITNNQNGPISNAFSNDIKSHLQQHIKFNPHTSNNSTLNNITQVNFNFHSVMNDMSEILLNRDEWNVYDENISKDDRINQLLDTLPMINSLEQYLINFNTGTSLNDHFVHPMQFLVNENVQLDDDQRRYFLFWAKYGLVEHYKYQYTIDSRNSNYSINSSIVSENNLSGIRDVCLTMTLGEAGSGKTFVNNLIKKYFHSWGLDFCYQFTATLGITAVSNGNLTWQKFLSAGYNTQTAVNTNIINEIELRRLLLMAIHLDEASLLSCKDLNTINDILQQWYHSDKIMGTKLLNLIVDFNQNGPCFGKPLIANIAAHRSSLFSTVNSATINGRTFFQEKLGLVFEMKSNHRQGNNSRYTQIMRRITTSSVTVEDCDFINERCLITNTNPMPNPLEPPYVPMITRSHLERYCIQSIVLSEMEKYQLVCLPAHFDTANENTCLLEQYRAGLYRFHEASMDKLCPNLVLFVGMPVLLTENSRKISFNGITRNVHMNQFGIANGTRAIIKKLIYNHNVTYVTQTIRIYGRDITVKVPSELPVGILITLLEKEQLKLRQKIHIPNVDDTDYIVSPVSRTIKVKSSTRNTFPIKMTQFPLMPGIAITGHKCEGQTFKQGCIVCSKHGKKWMYTAHSRSEDIDKMYNFHKWDTAIMRNLNKLDANYEREKLRFNRIKLNTDAILQQYLGELY
jgi:hypothetical protein